MLFIIIIIVVIVFILLYILLTPIITRDCDNFASAIRKHNLNNKIKSANWLIVYTFMYKKSYKRKMRKEKIIIKTKKKSGNKQLI